MADEQAYREALLAAVREVLRPYGDATATVAVADGPGGWYVEVVPAAPGAAAVDALYGGGDEVTLSFGETHLYLWYDDPAELRVEVVSLLAPVLAGEFEEAGRRGDAVARLRLPGGKIRTVGAVALPLPWRFRRVRRYAPYSATPRAPSG